MSNKLRCDIVEPKGKHTATVLFMHGLGDSSDGWSFLSQQYGSMQHIRWIFANAPVQPVTLNMGMSMPSWYDIAALGDEAERLNKDETFDEAGMLKSVAAIEQILDEQLKSSPTVTSESIVVGGFSQGGVISLLTGLLTKKKLAGVVGLSCYLPLTNKLETLTTATEKGTPFFLGHGTSDPVVKFKWGQDSYKFLQDNLNMSKVEFHSYKGLPHSANIEELKDLEAWLTRVLPVEQ